MARAEFYSVQGTASRQLPWGLVVTVVLAWLAGWAVEAVYRRTTMDLLHILIGLGAAVAFAAAASPALVIGKVRRSWLGSLVGLFSSLVGCYSFVWNWVRAELDDGVSRWGFTALSEGVDLAYEKGIEVYIPVSRVLETGTHVHYEADGMWLFSGGAICLLVMATVWFLVGEAFFCPQCQVEMESVAERYQPTVLTDSDALLERIAAGEVDPLANWEHERPEPESTRVDYHRCKQHPERSVVCTYKVPAYGTRYDSPKRVGRGVWLQTPTDEPGA